MNGANTEKLIKDPSDETSTPIIEVLPESCENAAEPDQIIIDREPMEPPSVSADTEQRSDGRSGFSVVFRRVICGSLSIAGVLSYGYLGFMGVGYLKNGGFRELAASRIFGGSVVSVQPMSDENTVPSDDVVSHETAPAEEELLISTENIGISDPDAVFNETKYDLEKESVETGTVLQMNLGGTVLVIHTHGTEGYAPEGDASADEDFRTNDPEESVVAVGKAFVEKLSSLGVNTIHCTDMFDEESYIDAYSRSGEAVTKYIEEHPEISYVIDIHRDAVIRENGDVVRSDGGSGAQLMIVCGTDEMGADFPDWRENFAFGKRYQHMLYERDPSLVRHMNLRGASFNQQLCDKYLLLEVGTCGNTLAEAITSAETAASVFAEMILAG